MVMPCSARTPIDSIQLSLNAHEATLSFYSATIIAGILSTIALRTISRLLRLYSPLVSRRHRSWQGMSGWPSGFLPGASGGGADGNCLRRRRRPITVAWWWAPVFATVIFAGFLEFLILGMVVAAAPLASIAATAFLVNFRRRSPWRNPDPRRGRRSGLRTNGIFTRPGYRCLPHSQDVPRPVLALGCALAGQLFFGEGMLVAAMAMFVTVLVVRHATNQRKVRHA